MRLCLLILFALTPIAVGSLWADTEASSAPPARETPSWFALPHWKPSSANGVESLVESVLIDDKRVLRLRYAFEASSGRHAGAYLYIGVRNAFEEMRLKVKSSTEGKVIVRLFDTDGEVVQYAIPVKMVGEWIDLRIELARPTGTFASQKGAILNKKADFPLKGIFFGLETPRGTVARGDLLLSDLELVR